MLLAVTGVAPGVGATTLSRSLRDWLRQRGCRVDYVEQDEVYTRQELAPMARELAVRESVGVETLVSAVVALVGSAADDVHDDSDGGSGSDKVVVLDSLFPFVSSLIEWGYGEHRISGFFDEVALRLGGLPVVVVYLDADVDAALANAAEREPPGWLEWYVEQLAKTTTAPPAEPALHTAAERIQYERELTLRLVADHHWDLLRIRRTDRMSSDEVLDYARRGLEPVLAER